ncbi:MAG: HD family hydrolase [Zestosphaera sp.]
MNVERISSLKCVVRSGWVIRGIPNSIAETVAGHTFEVTLISMYLADILTTECMKVDVEKTLKMSLVHDIPEVIVGDVVKLIKVRAPELFNEVELEAMSELGLSKYVDLMKDLNSGLSPEAELVKLSDTVATYLQGLRYFKTGYTNVEEIIDNMKNALKSMLNSWTPEACVPVLKRALENIGVDF